MVYASFLSSYIILWWGQVLWAVMVTLTGDVLFLLKWNHIWLSVQMLPYKMSLIWFWHSGMTPSVCAGREEKRKRCESLRSHTCSFHFVWWPETSLKNLTALRHSCSRSQKVLGMSVVNDTFLNSTDQAFCSWISVGYFLWCHKK